MFLLLAVALALDVTPHGDAALVEQGVDEKTKAAYWVLKENGDKVRLKCRIKCAPEGVTYLTVRLPGNGGGTILYGCDENGKGYPPWDMLDEGGLWEVDPGSYFYETIPIPEDMTKGRQEATVYIGANGFPSRRILRVYSHTDPLFKPPLTEDPGQVRKPYRYPRFKPLTQETVRKAEARLLAVMGEQADIVAGRQLWAPDWREKVAKGEWPADMIGGFDIAVIRKPDGTTSNLVQRLRAAFGAVKPGEFSLVSHFGIPNEHGGYSIEYNRGQEDMYYRAYKFTRLPFLKERALVTGDALATLMFPTFPPADRRRPATTAPEPYMLAPVFLNHRHRNILTRLPQERDARGPRDEEAGDEPLHPPAPHDEDRAAHPAVDFPHSSFAPALLSCRYYVHAGPYPCEV